MRTIADWEVILRAVGVTRLVAADWAPVCAEIVVPDNFSKGDLDILDFVPTILHESGHLASLKESGKYSAKRIRELGNASAAGSRWRSLVPRADELAYDGTQASEARFFEACYGGRMGNGPEGSGDGSLFPGRGLIGVTGRYGYQWLTDNGKLDNNDLVSVPWLLEQRRYAALNSIDWWEGNVPDAVLGDERRIRKVVNGGYFGIAEVERLAASFRKAWTA